MSLALVNEIHIKCACYKLYARGIRVKEFVLKHKKDILIICIFIIIAITFFIFNYITSGDGGRVVIYVEGEVYKTVPIEENKTYIIENDGRENVVEVKDGCVKMKSASCDNQVCVEHKKISRDNESIICLPNKVVVKVAGGKMKDVGNSDDIDAVVK